MQQERCQPAPQGVFRGRTLAAALILRRLEDGRTPSYIKPDAVGDAQCQFELSGGIPLRF